MSSGDINIVYPHTIVVLRENSIYILLMLTYMYDSDYHRLINMVNFHQNVRLACVNGKIVSDVIKVRLHIFPECIYDAYCIFFS